MFQVSEVFGAHRAVEMVLGGGESAAPAQSPRIAAQVIPGSRCFGEFAVRTQAFAVLFYPAVQPGPGSQQGVPDGPPGPLRRSRCPGAGELRGEIEALTGALAESEARLADLATTQKVIAELVPTGIEPDPPESPTAYRLPPTRPS